MAEKRIGKQTPTIHIADKYDYTLGDDCIAFCTSYGMKPDKWQEDQLRDWLAVDEDGNFVHKTIVLFVSRQNGKGGLIEMYIFYCTSVLGRKIIYSSHHMKTSRQAFEQLRDRYYMDEERYPELYTLCKKGEGISNSNGRERISCEWTENGEKKTSATTFIARTNSSSRGESKDVIIFDECQKLMSEQQASMLPAISASQNSPQVIYCGTPMPPEEPTDVVIPLRKSILAGERQHVCFSEWSVDEVGDVTDVDRWYDTNPALGIRISEDTIRDIELNGMPPEKFARERLGWWMEEYQALDHPVDKKLWESLATDDPSKYQGITSFGVKFDLSGRVASVCACIKVEQGCYYMEHIATFGNMQELTNFMLELDTNPAQIIIDGAIGAQDLAQRLIVAKYSKKCVILANSGIMANAVSMFVTALENRELWHYGEQEELNKSAIQCIRRKIGNNGLWGFEDNASGKAHVIESGALAYYAARTTKRNPERRGRVG